VVVLAVVRRFVWSAGASNDGKCSRVAIGSSGADANAKANASPGDLSARGVTAADGRTIAASLRLIRIARIAVDRV
jgi:hypothetical protein